MADGQEPIDDEELLFRRVPRVWFDPSLRQLQAAAFAPNKNRDISGLSLSRKKYNTIQQAALGQPGKSYFVAVLRARDVRLAGMRIEPQPLPNDPGHCEFPDLRAENYKDSVTLERQHKLVDLCLSVEGPFDTPPAATT